MSYMLETVKYRDWVFEVDRNRTEEVFSQRTSWTSGCECTECRNYAKQNKEACFPDEIKSLFKELGMDVNKEAEVVRWKKESGGLHVYCGWFNFKGRMIEGKSCMIPTGTGGHNVILEPINDKFSIGFHSGKMKVLSFNKDGPEELTQVEFQVLVPWVLEDYVPED